MNSSTELGNIITLQRGYDLPNRDRISGPYPIISSSGISGTHNEYKVSGENVITGRYGTIGEVYYYSGKCWPLNTSLFVKDFHGNNTRYSYYLLKHALKMLKIDGKDKSTVPGVDRNVLHQLKVPFIPSVSCQKEIVHILELLDKKIENNMQINDNLFAMSRAIYLHSFFGKKENTKISDVLLENKKSSIQVSEAKDSQGNYPFFTSGAAIYEWPEYLVEGKNIYLNTGGNADVKYYVGKAAYSTDTWCISAKNDLTDYLYLLLDSIKPELDQKFFQGTGLKHLQKPLIKDRKIYLPSTDELATFNSQVSQMLVKISMNTRENRNLADLRDWLLPMLMNGQAIISI